MSILFIHSHSGAPVKPFAAFAEEGIVEIVRDSELTGERIASAQGIITTMHLDQIGFAEKADALASFFASGGRLFFNGHVMRIFADGLKTYRPSLSRRLADLQLRQLTQHTVFGGIDPADMAVRKGVAGFYGRGHNPLPKGARALTGLGTLKQPVDWEWSLPGGGMMFSHAGNDLWSMAPEGSDGPMGFARRILDWTAGKAKGAAA